MTYTGVLKSLGVCLSGALQDTSPFSTLAASWGITSFHHLPCPDVLAIHRPESPEAI